MKDIRRIAQIILASCLIVVVFGSFNDDKDTRQDCSLAWIKGQNLAFRTAKTNPVSSSVEGPYENCVKSLSSSVKKTKELIEAYTHLIDYYNVVAPEKMAQFRNL